MSSLRDRLKAQREKIADKSAGFERTYKFQPGKTIFRILPGKEEADDFYENIGIHWIKDQNNKVITAVGDRTISYGEPCPVREAIEKYAQMSRDAGDDAGIERAKDMIAKSRFFANIVVLKAPGEFDKTKPVLAEFPETAWDQILSQLQDAIEDLPEDADLLKEGPFAFADGIAFVVERSGSGKETKYNVYMYPKKVAIDPSVMEQAVDLAAYKRAQFNHNTQKALGVLGAMIGLDMEEMADKLSGAPGAKQLAAPKNTKNPLEEDDDLEDLADVQDAEFDEVETKADEPAEDLSEDDILAELDDL